MIITLLFPKESPLNRFVFCFEGLKEGKKACCGSGRLRGTNTCGGQMGLLQSYESFEKVTDCLCFTSPCFRRQKLYVEVKSLNFRKYYIVQWLAARQFSFGCKVESHLCVFVTFLIYGFNSVLGSQICWADPDTT